MPWHSCDKSCPESVQQNHLDFCKSHYPCKQEDDRPWRIESFFEEIWIDNGVTSISDYAFYGINGFTLELPDTLQTIGKYAFAKCSTARWSFREDTIVFPKGLKIIGEGAFSDCAYLKEITLPDSIERIEKDAFRNCERLEKIILPDKPIEIDPTAFFGCPAMIQDSPAPAEEDRHGKLTSDDSTTKTDDNRGGEGGKFTLDFHIHDSYRYKGSFTDDEFVKYVSECGHFFDGIELEDSGDCGMKYFGGTYSVEEYFELSRKMYLDTEYIYVTFPRDGVSMFARDYEHTVDFTTDHPDFDLNEFFFGSQYRKKGQQDDSCDTVPGEFDTPTEPKTERTECHGIRVMDCDVSDMYDLYRKLNDGGRNIYILRGKKELFTANSYFIAFYDEVNSMYAVLKVSDSDLKKLFYHNFQKSCILEIIAHSEFIKQYHRSFREAENS